MLTIIKLNEEVGHLNSELARISKFVCMLNSIVDNLDVILSICKPAKKIEIPWI